MYTSLEKNCKIFLIAIFLSFGITPVLIPFNLSAYSDEINKKEELNLNSIQNNEYILGPGDKIFINFYDDQNLAKEITIINDGTASLPFIGNIYISGITIKQLTYKLRSLYENELLNPELSIEVVKPRPIRVSLAGEIERPGIYTMNSKGEYPLTGYPDSQAPSITGLPTLVDAIQKAGGITSEANISNVELIRRLPLLPNKKSIEHKKATFNLIALIFNGDQEQNPILFDGDIIRIDSSPIGIEQKAEVIKSNLSPNTINVNVVGEVMEPKQLVLSNQTRLNQAVMSAGGLSRWGADSNNIRLIRVKRNGKLETKRYKLNLEINESKDKNPILRNLDTIIVGRTSQASVLANVNAYVPTSQGIANLFSIFKLFND